MHDIFSKHASIGYRAKTGPSETLKILERASTVKPGDMELFGHPKIVPLTPNVPNPYEVNWQLVTGNGSLTPICFLSKRSLSPSLTVVYNVLAKI